MSGRAMLINLSIPVIAFGMGWALGWLRGRKGGAS